MAECSLHCDKSLLELHATIALDRLGAASYNNLSSINRECYTEANNVKFKLDNALL